MSILDYKKKNDSKILHSSTKLTDSDSDIDEAFKSMDQSNDKNKNYAWLVLDVFIKSLYRFLHVSTSRINSKKKWR